MFQDQHHNFKTISLGLLVSTLIFIYWKLTPHRKIHFGLGYPSNYPFYLYYAEFRMLDWNKWYSRIWWNSSRLRNSVQMSNSLCQRQHVCRYWLGPEQCWAILLDSDVHSYRTYHGNWSHDALRTGSCLPAELVVRQLHQFASDSGKN